jgi:predicted Fe-Mo cluster-binding NifX family protein
MLTAVSADGKELSCAVSEHFEACPYLLIIETDDLAAKTEIKSVQVLENDTPADGVLLAQLIIGRDCEAVITGAFTPPAFNELADAGVTRYCGAGLSIGNAILSMDASTLPYIRYADENDKCHGEHSGGECNCDGDD